jgi:hypothetical protein
METTITRNASNRVAVSVAILGSLGDKRIDHVKYLVLLATGKLLHLLERLTHTALRCVTMSRFLLTQYFFGGYAQCRGKGDDFVSARQFSRPFPETQIRRLHTNLPSNCPQRESRGLPHSTKGKAKGFGHGRVDWQSRAANCAQQCNVCHRRWKYKNFNLLDD